MSPSARLLITMSFLFFALPGCDTKRYYLNLRPEPTASVDDVRKAMSVITKRLKLVYGNNITATLSDSLIHLEIRNNTDVKDLILLVSTVGKFSLKEAYTKNEIIQATLEVDPQASGFRYLNIHSAGNSAEIGLASRYDTAEINRSSTLRALKEKLGDVTFMWGRENKQWDRPFLALRNTLTREIGNSAIKNAMQSYDELGPEAVFVELKEEFHETWLTMTRNNIGRPIAICIDGEVFSAPIVASEIPGGKLQISGDFRGEALIIAAVISSDPLPITITVSSIDSALTQTKKRDYPSASQVEQYEAIRQGLLQRRHQIDSILRASPSIAGLSSTSNLLGKIYHEDLNFIVNDMNLTEEEVDVFLLSIAAFRERLDERFNSGHTNSAREVFEYLEGHGEDIRSKQTPSRKPLL